MAYYYMGYDNGPRGHDRLHHSRQFPPHVSRIPVAGEYEVKNAIAMKIWTHSKHRRIIHGILRDGFRRRHVLMGHDGPGHIAIAQGQTKVRPLGGLSRQSGARGLSVEMSVRHGPVTLLSVVETVDGAEISGHALANR